MTIRRRQFLTLAGAAVALPALPHMARAQAYPARPVRVVIGYTPGG
jgi:tripartite-type tricarboxylate transporter receptor subunit TctC